MWTVGSTEVSAEKAAHHSGLDGDYQLMVTMGVISLVAFSSLFSFDQLDFPGESVRATIYVITE